MFKSRFDYAQTQKTLTLDWISLYLSQKMKNDGIILLLSHTPDFSHITAKLTIIAGERLNKEIFFRIKNLCLGHTRRFISLGIKLKLESNFENLCPGVFYRFTRMESVFT